MARSQSVQTCRWGAPTLFLPWPLWYDASEYEWSCTRGTHPRGLTDPGHCAKCAGWAAPLPPAPHHDDDHLGSVAP